MQEQYNAIGETAGKIYQMLEKKGSLTVEALQKEVQVADAALVNQTLGWLAREDKVDFKKSGKNQVVSLLGAAQPA